MAQSRQDWVGRFPHPHPGGPFIATSSRASKNKEKDSTKRGTNLETETGGSRQIASSSRT